MAATDTHNVTSPTCPKHIVLITPDNSNDLTNAITGISFAAAGTLKVTTLGGETVTIPSGALAAGVQHSMQVVRVFATDTTVTDIVGYY